MLEAICYKAQLQREDADQKKVSKRGCYSGQDCASSAGTKASCGILQALEKYLELSTQLMERHTMLQKLHGIYSFLSNTLTTAQEQELEKIDKVVMERMKYAETKYRKLAMGEVACLPELAMARQWKVWWTKIIYSLEVWGASECCSHATKGMMRSWGVPLSCM